MLDMQKAVGCGWEKAEKGDGVQIQWRELGEKGKTKLAEFCVGSYGAVSDKACSDLWCWDWVGGGENNERETDCRIPRT